MNTPTLNEALALALKLDPKERLQLIERLASSVEREMDVAPPDEQKPEEHWGQSLVQLIQSLDMSDWENMEIDDPVEWVNSLRKEQENRLKPYWDGEK